MGWTPRETLTLKAGQYKYTGTTPLNIPPPQILPTRPTRPASWVTRSCLHRSGADELTQEEGSTAYIHTPH